MRKVLFIVSTFMLLTCGSVLYGQGYTRKGTQFIAETEKSQETKTGYTYKDKAGVVYDIYISKKGNCYIWKTSKKTGKKYKYSLPKGIASEIKELEK